MGMVILFRLLSKKELSLPHGPASAQAPVGVSFGLNQYSGNILAMTTSLTDKAFKDMVRDVRAPVALAVSGGPDSMALAYLASRAGIACHALIVDHGLRAESATEAQQVLGWLSDMGISADILTWQHDGVDSRIHVAARRARYDLLIEVCKERGFSQLLLAHHKNDQAETILMRFAKGSGIDGLAGIARTAEQNGVQLIRPFLGTPKRTLLDVCTQNKIPFVTDPSNEKACYARGRLRKVSDLLAAEGFTTDRLIDLGERAAEAKEALQHYTDELLRASVTLLPSGALQMDVKRWLETPQAVRLRALSECLRYIAPSTYAPERKQLFALASWIGGEGAEQGRTLHGVEISKGKALTFSREYAVMNHKLSGEGLWDNRWQIEGWGPNCAYIIKALGVQEKAVLDEVLYNLRRIIPSGKQRATLPALWDGDQLIAVLGVTDAPQKGITATLKKPRWLH